VSRLKEELHALQENYSYVGEVVKVMGKNRVLVKVLLAIFSSVTKENIL
jgi:ATP-dependent 26S proteasome regulatory subunit